MPYTIEDGVPAPRLSAPGESKIALIRAMKPGQSIHLDTREEANVFRSLASRVAKGKFRVLGEAGEGAGWRIYRY